MLPPLLVLLLPPLLLVVVVLLLLLLAALAASCGWCSLDRPALPSAPPPPCTPATPPSLHPLPFFFSSYSWQDTAMSAPRHGIFPVADALGNIYVAGGGQKAGFGQSDVHTVFKP